MNEAQFFAGLPYLYIFFQKQEIALESNKLIIINRTSKN